MQNTQENKATNKPTLENITYTDITNYRVKTEKNTYGYNFYVSGDTTNCKLSYIHGIGSLIHYIEDEYKQVIDTLLTKCKGVVLLNTTNINIAKFLKNNYTYYYYHEVPIGYNGGYQYHILIRNDISPNHNCRNPEIKVNTPDDFKANFKTKLLQTLKKLRRKDDYVDELINSL